MGEPATSFTALLKSTGFPFPLAISPLRVTGMGPVCTLTFPLMPLRNKEGGLDAINQAVKNLERDHLEHIKHYGQGFEERLTGLHETCHISEFKSGVSNSGCLYSYPRGHPPQWMPATWKIDGQGPMQTPTWSLPSWLAPFACNNYNSS